MTDKDLETDDDSQYLEYDLSSDLKTPADDERPPRDLVTDIAQEADPAHASEASWARLASQLSRTNIAPRHEGQLQQEVVIALQKADVHLLR
jgi:hypothetical protein